MTSDTIHYFPYIEGIGILEMIEEYIYYDRPVLAAYRNLSDQIYLAVLVDEDQHKERWHLVAVSSNRLNSVRTGRLDLWTAFARPENGNVFRIDYPFDVGEEIVVSSVSASQLTEDELPIPNATLQVETDTLPIVTLPEPEEARQRMRDYVSVSFIFPDITGSEAPAARLGIALRDFQTTVTSFGHVVRDKAVNSGQFLSSIVNQTQMNVVAVGAGSFKVEMASHESSDIVYETLAGESVKLLIDMIEIGTDLEKLSQKIPTLRKRATSHYVTLLRSLGNDIEQTEIVLASPSIDQIRTTVLTAQQANNIATQISAMSTDEIDEIELLGELYAGNSKRDTFGLEPLDRDIYPKAIHGEVAPSAQAELSKATLSKVYLVRVERTIHLRPSGAMDISYVLLSLTPPPKEE